MKTKLTNLILIAASLLGTFVFSTKVSGQAKKITMEEVTNTCKGIPRKDRITIRVARFSVSSRAAQASGQFGEELTAIMTSALQQTNCFRVLDALKNQSDSQEEIGFNESGATSGNGSQRGKQLSAQAIVAAEITEYSDGSSSAGAFGISLGKSKAKIGLIISVKDPETGEVIWTKSANGEGSKGGFAGAKVLGINLAGSTKVSEAMSAAVEDLVLNTVALLVKEKNEILSEFDASENNIVAKEFNSDNCKMLSGSYIPKVMVIVPEYHISAKIPDPAGETEILRKFTEAGFRAIDPAMFASLRYGAKLKEAMQDPMDAIALGKQYGADIIIYGEGFSQFVSKENNTVTCRARVEVKAVRTDNAQVIATHGLHAGGQDLAESTSSKSALRNAGGRMADYLLERMCKQSFSTNAPAPDIDNVVAQRSANSNSSIISIANVNFTKLNSLANTLKSNSSVLELKKELKGSNGQLTIDHKGSTEDFADLISKLITGFEITGVEDGKISMSTK